MRLLDHFRTYLLRTCGYCSFSCAVLLHTSGDKLILHDNSPSNKVEHLIVRIYGALILGQVRACGIAAADSTRILARVTLYPRSAYIVFPDPLQFWIVWKVRAIEDAHTRRALVQAYAIVFALTAIALLRAQLTEGGHFNAWNWLNIAMFVGLSAFYTWFVAFEPIAVFEGLDKAVA